MTGTADRSQVAKFRARARALDMLGRQQIAGVPSAINELFKNAYDAYATKVEGHLVREADLLVIRDNGVGMTIEDFLNKWLILGTESKYGSEGTSNPTFRPSHIKPRPTAGEKGIGRLAIGILGPQVFVWTKAVRDDGAHPAVAAFVNWSAFGVPNIDLEDIEIPVLEIMESEYPNEKALKRLVSLFRNSFVGACKGKATQGEDVQVLRELDKSAEAIGPWLSALQTEEFGPETHGTLFAIQPCSASLYDSVELDSRDSVGKLVQELAGFSNTMATAEEDRPIQAMFWDHRGLGNSTELLGDADFWQESDFDLADHRISGTVDEFGAFRGAIRIFRNSPIDHIVPYKAGHGHKTECGAFQLNLGIVQGALRESSLDPEEFALMQQRLRRFAGVYVYRDGLRVLPYGRSDQDWLHIEERRTLSATYYFFSHRRMFGYVAVARRANAGLREKAGREGFQENKAYKQLREILEALLVQLTADFFRGDRDDPTPFRLAIKANTRETLAKERHAKSKKARVQSFRESLRTVEALLNEEALQREVQRVIDETDSRAQSMPVPDNSAECVRQLVALEADANSQLGAVWRKLDFSRPKGIALAKDLQRAYEGVVERREWAEPTVFAPARKRIREILDDAAHKAGTAINERVRVTSLLDNATATVMRDARRQASAIKTSAESLTETVAMRTQEILSDLDQQLRTASLKATEVDFEHAELAEGFLRSTLHEIRLTSEFFSTALSSLVDMYTSLDIEWDPGTGLITSLDKQQSLDQEIEDLNERADADLELTQMGLSVDIINHEFLGSVNSIRKALKSLDSWVAINPDMRTLGSVLNANFTHLENFMGLFTPLRKRFNIEKSTIRGTEIVDYLNSIFVERLKVSSVELRVTQEFRSKNVRSYAAVILPVFTNLVDNALFWLSDQPEPRIIELTVVDGEWYVSDTGPGIPSRYQDSVFAAGFTTKPGGRGLGLFVARQVLERNGFEIEILDAPRLGRGTTFRIGTKKHEDSKDS